MIHEDFKVKFSPITVHEANMWWLGKKSVRQSDEVNLSMVSESIVRRGASFTKSLLKYRTIWIKKKQFGPMNR